MTPSVGIEYLEDKSTHFVRFSIVLASNSLPIATIGAIAEALRRTASSIDMTHSLLSSVRMVEPALKRSASGTRDSGGITLLSAPRVHIMQSADFTRGTIDMSMRSKPLVGPIIYPWSKASMTVLPLLGLKIDAIRAFMPQSAFPSPFKKNAPVFLDATSALKLLASIFPSISGIRSSPV